ncbi:MAG TPA: DUF898 family protein [Novosphingobium sp.]
MQDQDYTAFEFEGRWQDYAPIAFTNLLLTLVTLGIYRFWGKARTRSYLWAHTRFIDDRLQWVGTGGELFRGALMALVVIVLPLVLLNMVVQSLMLHGRTALGGLLGLVQFGLLFFLIGLALFRSLRYRLSRTYWRGIRGGSEDPGLAYGWSYLWKRVVSVIPFGLLVPWSLVCLWNERWSRMSFGQYRFTATATTDGLMGRFLLCYLAPFAGLLVVGLAMAAAVGLTGGAPAPKGPLIAVAVLAGIFGFYLLFGLVVMAFYAKFFRQMVEGMSLHTLTFRFSATTRDWFVLILGDFALVLATLGIGLIFLDYRHWKFFITHLEAFGEIEMEAIGPSTTPELRQGEGLLDAFDMGAL